MRKACYNHKENWTAKVPQQRGQTMAAITLEEAQAHLKDIIAGASPGEELVITEDQKIVARLIIAPPHESKPRKPGTLKGTVLYMAPDFDAPLEEFKEYTK
jgi:antitoxin (DNA-binding transcriptional repressor) of toxin-antitoxin stability system